MALQFELSKTSIAARKQTISTPRQISRLKNTPSATLTFKLVIQYLAQKLIP